MINQGIKSDLITYNALIDGLCKICNLKEVRKFVNEMSERSVKSNKITFTTLIRQRKRKRRRSKKLRLLPTNASNQCSKYNNLVKFRDTCPTS
ncbi:hypothetical protein AHAS_Ahas01G0117200 [Arachis hypogaea]